MPEKILMTVLTALLVTTLTACSKEFVGGVAAGGAVAGGAYEYSNKRQLDDLEEDYKEGKISREEYERRKREIEKRSLVY